MLSPELRGINTSEAIISTPAHDAPAHGPRGREQRGAGEGHPQVPLPQGPPTPWSPTGPRAA